MSSVTLTGTQTRTSLGDRWRLGNNALQNDSLFAFRASGGLTTDYLIIENFTAGLPQDITIQGITVTIKASTDVSGSNAHLGVFLSTNGRTNDSSTLTTTSYVSSLSTSETTYTIGGSSYTLGIDWRRPLIHGNPSFSVFIFGAGNLDVGRKIQYVSVTIEYTLNTYLRGERSGFPIPTNRWPYSSPTDAIPTQFNSTGSSSQITSEDVNLLGDCLYTLEKTALNPPSIIRSEGGESTNLSPQSLFAFTTTISGAWAGNLESIYFHNTQRINGQTREIISNQTTTNLTSITWTKPPIIPFNMYSGVLMPMVQGIAWITSGSIYIPLHLTVTTCLFRRTFEYIPTATDVMTSVIGVRLVNPNSYSVSQSSISDWAGTHYGYTVNDWMSISDPVTVTIKLTGFASIGS